MTTRQKRTQGTETNKKCLCCVHKEIPGTSFTTDLAVGHHQGIQESFPNLKFSSFESHFLL